ncbi:DinB family protein [Yimella lutea]|uniref:DinB family protein n=1 Tax=Yimella lutea TaxID=587872 RepID=UPI001153E6C6|nr:DinB family protein [Yimella lutea]
MMFTELPVISGTGREQPMLREYLTYQRVVVRRKAEGLSDGQLRARLSGHPSALTVGGILKHLSWVEVKWAEAVFRGIPYELIQEPWASRRGTDAEWEWDTRGESGEQVLALYDRATRVADDVYDSVLDFDRVGVRAGSEDPGQTPDADAPSYALRWILLHLIQEYSRHAGHLDLLREQIDGSTGD